MIATILIGKLWLSDWLAIMLIATQLVLIVVMLLNARLLRKLCEMFQFIIDQENKNAGA